MQRMNTITCTTERPGSYRHRIDVRAHELHADASVADGGEDSAPGAHDLFDASLAACKSLTAMWYAKKNGFPLETVDVRIERDNAEERSGRYRLLVQVTFHGPLSDEQRTRLAAAVARCPISKLMTTTEVILETVPG